MATINSNIRRLEAGSIVTIRDLAAGTADTIANIEAGSVRWEPGLEEPLAYMDRGTLNASPLAGDERPTTVELSVKFSKMLSVSGELYKRLTAAPSSGLVPRFEIIIKIPDYKGHTAGESVTFAYCYVAPGGLKYQAGDRFDTLSISLIDLEARPVTAAYS